MPELISRPNIKIHGADVSQHVRAVSIDRQQAEIDTSTAESHARTYEAGLVDGSITIEWLGVIGEENRLGIGQTGRLNLIPNASEAASATNPEYRLRVTPYNQPSPTGRLGELSTEQTTFRLETYSQHTAAERTIHTRTRIGHWQSTTRAPWWIIGAFESAHTFSDTNRDPEHSFSAGIVTAELQLPSFDESRHVLFFGAPTDLGDDTEPTTFTMTYDTGNDTTHPVTLIGDEYDLLALADGIAYEDECAIYRVGGTYDTARAPQTARLTYA